MTMIEQVVCKENEIVEGELKLFEVGPGKVLVSKYEGKLSAVSSKCTHYGAPLNTGAYKDGKVRCPWHGACFSTVTGDIEDYPGLDSLQKYEIFVKDGDVVVKGTEETLSQSKRVKCMTFDGNSEETTLIIGGGGAAIVCAETLRQQGYAGLIIMATKEHHVPYDRPKLSKMLNSEASKLYLRSKEFFEENNITLATNKEVVELDSSSNRVKYKDGSEQQYSQLFIATGGRPRLLNVPGHGLKNIFYLRSPEDGNQIHNESQGKNVVILGTGFIGMEIASYLASKANSVTVIGSGRTKVPFERNLGSKIGAMFMKLHEEKGVKLNLSESLKEIHGKDGSVTGVKLSNGTELPADVIIAGIGVTPCTEFAKDSGLSINKQGNIVVDKYMRTNIKNIYAGGDIVSFPYCYDNDKLINIGHWQLAAAHGRCAAMNMGGKVTPVRTVPFFWTQQYGKSLRFAGFCNDYDEILYEGNVEEMKFAAYYCRNGKVYSMACMNMGAKASEMAFVIESGENMTAQQVRALYSS